MGKYLFSIVVVVALASQLQIEAFPRHASGSRLKPMIIGGTIAPLGSAPHQISLLYGGINNGSYVGCGGAILNENYILTAAHCAEVADKLSIRAGLNTLDNPEQGSQTVEVSEIMIHEEWDMSNLVNDIALLRLATPLKLDLSVRTAAIKLPPRGYTASGNVTVTGWGTGEQPGLSNVLRKLTMGVISDEDCRLDYGKDLIVDEMLCAGLVDGGHCSGDSGGPLVEERSGLLVGVVSFGSGCNKGEHELPGVFAETSHYIDWIEKHMH